jgi:glucosyl-dolichyl phosphate glucuronosyltransferase
MGMGNIAVSVIVTTVSRARLSDFQDLVRALMQQDVDDFELIVIVDENHEHYLDIKKLVKDCPFPVKVEFNDNNLGLAHSRNMGIGIADGNLLAFIDDDAEPGANWVRTIREVFKDPLVGAVTGDIEPRWMVQGMDWFPEELFWMISCSYSITPKERGEIDRGFGVDMAFSRTAIEAVGPFDTKYGINKKRWIGGEDTEMFLRVSTAGYKVIYEPDMRVRHHIHPDRLRLDKLAKRAIAQGRGTVILKRGMRNRVHDHSGKSYILDTVFRFVPSKMRGLLTREAMGNIRDLGLVLTINIFIVMGYVLEIIKPIDGS